MVRVALARLPATYATWYKRPMMGISYLAALLEQAGFDAIDLCIDFCT
jgi:hypothetical protein